MVGSYSTSRRNWTGQSPKCALFRYCQLGCYPHSQDREQSTGQWHRDEFGTGKIPYCSAEVLGVSGEWSAKEGIGGIEDRIGAIDQGSVGPPLGFWVGDVPIYILE